MILVFTTNENGKIEFTKEELEELLEKVEAETKKNSTITLPSNKISIDKNVTPFEQNKIYCKNINGIHQVDYDPNTRVTWTGDDPVFSDKITGKN